MKRPGVVTVEQWFEIGDHSNIIPYRPSDVDWYTSCPVCGEPNMAHGWLVTPEGGHRVCPGNWIVTSVP